MPLNETAKNFMLDQLGSNIAYISLHSGDPGSTGVNELSGGSPAYARKAVSWNAAASSNLDSNGTQVFDVPAGSTVAYIGYWSALTGGTFYGSGDVTDETYASQGVYTLSDSDIALT